MHVTERLLYNSVAYNLTIVLSYVQLKSYENKLYTLRTTRPSVLRLPALRNLQALLSRR